MREPTARAPETKDVEGVVAIPSWWQGTLAQYVAHLEKRNQRVSDLVTDQSARLHLHTEMVNQERARAIRAEKRAEAYLGRLRWMCWYLGKRKGYMTRELEDR